MWEIATQYYFNIFLGAMAAVLSMVSMAVMALFSGVRALLRNEIIHSYHHYMAKEYIPFYALENINEMYGAYHRLRGNGAITKLVEEIRTLSSFKEERKNEN